MSFEWDEIEEPEARVVRDGKYAIKHDTLDRLDWNVLVSNNETLYQHMQDLAKDFPTSPEAYEDLYNILHQTLPRPSDPETILDEYAPQWAMLQGISQSDAVALLRTRTVLDDYYTGFALIKLKEDIRKAFEDLQKSMAAASSAAASAAKAEKDLVNRIIQEVTKELSSINGELKDQDDAAASYGIDPGELQHMNFDERLELMKKLQASRIRNLAGLVGAFRASAKATRKARLHGPLSRPSNVTLGRDLERLTPSELTRLAVPELEDDFWLRYAKGTLMIHESDPLQSADRGPIIVVCDESSSMRQTVGSTGKTREAWSKAVALALADQARKEKRDFTYIGFASASQIWERSFRRGRISPHDLVEFTSHFLNGGTSYEGPLRSAMEHVKAAHGRTSGHPDIVFITDDECQVSEEFVQEWKSARELTGTKCYGILVGVQGYRNNMRDLTDECISVSRLTTKEMQPLFDAI